MNNICIMKPGNHIPAEALAIVYPRHHQIFQEYLKSCGYSTPVDYTRAHQTAGNNMNDINTHSKGIDLTLLTAQELKTRYQNLQKQRSDFMKQIADVDQQLEQIRAVAQRITSA